MNEVGVIRLNLLYHPIPRKMNKFILCLSFVVASFAATAQKVYFIYLQTDAEQPFFVKINDKIHSSSASGYLILSRLHDSTYSFSVGFPQNKWPEQNFTVTINKKDHGFLLKNFGDKGWGLFDLQTMTVQMSATAPAKATSSSNLDASPFTDILSKASNDPSLKERPARPVVEEKKPEIVITALPKNDEPKTATKESIPEKTVTITKPAQKEESAPVSVKEPTKPTENEPVATEKTVAITDPAEKKEVPPAVAVKEEPKPVVKESVPEKSVVMVEPIVKKEEPAVGTVKEEVKPVTTREEPATQLEIKPLPAEEYKKSTVTRRSESSTTEGFGLVFIDEYANGDKDTVRLIIPNPRAMAVAVKKEEPKEEKKFLDMPADTNTKKEEPKLVEVHPVMVDSAIAKQVSKGNCVATAEESDFFKLRKTMAAAENDDDMITEAKKYFKSKCFSTAQIKNLSTLFLNDEGKYKFFDAAYNFSTDASNYVSLQAELKDEYYINRFKAMLRN